MPRTIQQVLASLSYTSVMWPLFLGLAALIVLKKSGWDATVKALVIVGICLLATVGDWSVFAVMWILIFSHNKDNPKRQMFLFAASTLLVILSEPAHYLLNGLPVNPWLFFQAGLLLAVPLLLCYNHQRGGNRLTKWFFYLFYPLHLIIIAAAAYGLI